MPYCTGLDCGYYTYYSNTAPSCIVQHLKRALSLAGALGRRRVGVVVAACAYSIMGRGGRGAACVRKRETPCSGVVAVVVVVTVVVVVVVASTGVDEG